MSIRKPWWRKEKSCWYVWHDGRQARLDPDEGRAYLMWHQLALGQLVRDASPTISDLIDAYLLSVAGNVCDQVMLHKQLILGHIKGRFGTRKASSFTHKEALAWIEGGPTWGRSGRWSVAKTIKAAWHWAELSNLIESNPLKLLRLPSCASRGASALISPETHQRLLDAAPDGIRDVLVALHQTGCRPSEVMQLQSINYDRPSGTWTLTKHKTSGKTFAVRTVYLTTLMVEVSERLCRARPTGRMFVNGLGNPCSPRCVERWMRRACARLGVKATCYGYRHTLATDLLEAGVPDAHVAEILGHRTTRMLHQHYSHLGSKVHTMRGGVKKVRE